MTITLARVGSFGGKGEKCFGEIRYKHFLWVREDIDDWEKMTRRHRRKNLFPLQSSTLTPMLVYNFPFIVSYTFPRPSSSSFL